MNSEVKKCLYDMRESVESVESIEAYLGDKQDFTIYQSNKMLRRAIEREFEIIGEAMTRLNKLDTDIDISNKCQIISMRNRVIHGYDKVDDEIVWETIVRHSPTLKAEVNSLLSS